MFVGDSLSLNMWQSLACMIYASVPNVKTSIVRKDPLSYVTFQVHYRTHIFIFLFFVFSFCSSHDCIFCLLSIIIFIFLAACTSSFNILFGSSTLFLFLFLFYFLLSQFQMFRKGKKANLFYKVTLQKKGI